MDRHLCRACQAVLHSHARRNYSTAPDQRHVAARRASKTIFSGIQPTGVPHLGNYIGALKPWVDVQTAEPAETQIIISIVDLHAITVPQKASQLRAWRREMLASLLAIGLDPDRCTIYEQSRVPEHSELAWILGTLAPIGTLGRMTQWKSKSGSTSIDLGTLDGGSNSSGNLNLGLFSYPVLQAADVLLYKTTHVPVGDDQAQHIELCRTLAKLFNNRFCGGGGIEECFPLPATVLRPEGARISSLRDPTKKMSKSDPNEKSRINLTDTPEAMRRKIASAVTDSTRGVTYEPADRPGVANLLDILCALQTSHSLGGPVQKTPQELALELKDASHRELKEVVAETVVARLEPVRERYDEYVKDTARLERTANDGADKARAVAVKTMREVRRLVGFA